MGFCGCYAVMARWLDMVFSLAGQRLRSLALNDHHYFAVTENGFDENHSVGAEHESLTSVACYILRLKQ